MNECNETLDLLNRPTFVGLLTTELTFGLLGTISNIFLLVGLCKVRLFHRNLRILLIHMCLLALCYSSAATMKTICIMIKRKRNPCELVMTYYDCKLKELILVLPLLSTMYSLISIGVERVYATFTYHTYEKSRNVCLSVTLIVLTWMFPLISQLPPLWSVSRTEVTPFCVNLLVMTEKAALKMLILVTVQELIALALYSVTYIINKKLYAKLLVARHLNQTLSSRFQLAQNIQVSELMLPTAAVHAAFILPTGVLAVSVVCGLKIDFVRSVEIVHGAYLSALMYSSVHPLICFVRNEPLRRAVLALLPWPRNGIVYGYGQRMSQHRRYTNEYPLSELANESEKHFEILLRAWQAPGGK